MLKDGFLQYLQVFGVAASCTKTLPCFNVTSASLQVGSSFLPRRTGSSVSRSSRRTRRPLHRQLRPMSSLMTCIRMNWMCILVCKTNATPLKKLLLLFSSQQLVFKGLCFWHLIVPLGCCFILCYCRAFTLTKSSSSAVFACNVNSD